MQPGRATGNYYEAYRLCNNKEGGRINKRRTRGGGCELDFTNTSITNNELRNYITTYLCGRPELSGVNGTSQNRTQFINSFPTNADTDIFCIFARMYTYIINNDNKQTFIDLFYSIMKENIQTLDTKKQNLMNSYMSFTKGVGGKKSLSRKSLDKCTVAELKEKAQKRGIKVTGLKKDEILAKLRKK